MVLTLLKVHCTLQGLIVVKTRLVWREAPSRQHATSRFSQKQLLRPCDKSSARRWRSNYTEMWVSLTHFRTSPPTLELSCYRQYSKRILLQCQKKQCRNVFFSGTSWEFATTATLQAIILLVLWLAEMMARSTFVPCLHNSASRARDVPCREFSLFRGIFGCNNSAERGKGNLW